MLLRVRDSRDANASSSGCQRARVRVHQRSRGRGGGARHGSGLALASPDPCRATPPPTVPVRARANEKRRCYIARMFDAPIATTLGLGFVLGLKHALDADHIAAVASLTESGAGLRRAV